MQNKILIALALGVGVVIGHFLHMPTAHAQELPHSHILVFMVDTVHGLDVPGKVVGFSCTPHDGLLADKCFVAVE